MIIYLLPKPEKHHHPQFLFPFGTDIIRAIAGYENRSLADIFTEVAEEYIARHRETLELLRIPGFVEECQSGFEEITSSFSPSSRKRKLPPSSIWPREEMHND